MKLEPVQDSSTLLDLPAELKTESTPVESAEDAEQRAVSHAAGYVLSELDKTAVKSGRALFITGHALALARRFCVLAEPSEAMWYWLTDAGAEDCLINDIFIPGQEASAAFVRAQPDAVMAANRAARARGKRIIGAAHSHGTMPVFSSNPDVQNMHQLAVEGVGHRGVLEEPLRLQSGAEAVALAGGHVQLAVKASLSRPVLHSFFSTHNARGEDWWPVYHRVFCPLCEAFAATITGDAEIHIVGGETISEEDEAVLQDAVARIQPLTYGGGYFSEFQNWNSGRIWRQPVSTNAFQVFRHGQRVGSIPAAVLEEAASKCPALKAALNW